jgi:hypothetical protein
VLCLDEFENPLRRREEFTEDFFNAMRANLSAKRLAMITASQQSLRRLSIMGKLSSPFFNIFGQTNLRDFSQEQGYNFVHAHQQFLPFTDAELLFIRSHMDRHPLKLQVLCSWVVKNRALKLSDRRLANEIEGECRNYVVGPLALQVLKFWGSLSLDSLQRVLDVLRSGRDILSRRK